MSESLVIGLVFALVAVGAIAASFFWHRHVLKLDGERAILDAAYDVATRENQALRREGAHHRDTLLLCENLTRQLEQTTRERNDFARREEERRLSIEGILRERDNAWKLYDDQVIGHGNAQVLMMSGIAYLHEKLRQHGVTVEMPSIIKETHDLYVQEHVNPVLERSGTHAIHKDIPGQPLLTEKA